MGPATDPGTDPAAGPVPVLVLAGQLGTGGSERQLFLFLQACDRSRWQPHVLASSSLGMWAQAISELGVPVSLLHGSRIAKAGSIRRACRQSGAKAFISWSSYTNAYALSLLGLGIPRTGSFRNAGFSDLPQRGRSLWAFLSLRAVRTLVCNSEESARELRTQVRPGQRVVYVRNAVEAVPDVAAARSHWRRELGVADDEVLAMGVGRLCAQKNFGRFIEAVSLAAPGRALRAVIVGPDHGLGAELQQQIDSSGAAPGTMRLIGELAAAREAVCAADVLLLSSDHEGMPNVVLEAMAAGVPVVSTRVNGVGSLIHEGVSGLITDADSRALAQALGQLADDPVLRVRMGQRGLADVTSGYGGTEVYGPLWQLLGEQLAEPLPALPQELARTLCPTPSTPEAMP